MTKPPKRTSAIRRWRNMFGSLQSAVFTETLTSHLRDHEPQMREFAAAYVASRSRLGLPAVGVEEVMYARAVDIVISELRRTELLTSRDIAGAVRSSKALLQREAREKQFDDLLTAIVVHVNSERGRIERDAAMENRARLHRGLPHVRTDALVVQIALKEVFDRVHPSRLTDADIKAVSRAARARVIDSLLSEPNKQTVAISPASTRILR